MKQRTLKFQVGRGKNRQFYWRIRASNGEIIAQGEGYKQRRAALRVHAILWQAFTNQGVDVQEVDDKGRAVPTPKYVGTVVAGNTKIG